MLATRGAETHLKKEERRCISLRLDLGTSTLERYKSKMAMITAFFVSW
jgi:hypothetical protein